VKFTNSQKESEDQFERPSTPKRASFGHLLEENENNKIETSEPKVRFTMKEIGKEPIKDIEVNVKKRS